MLEKSRPYVDSRTLLNAKAAGGGGSIANCNEKSPGASTSVVSMARVTFYQPWTQARNKNDL